jgi:predicted N-acetyltransferase YhbS
MDEPTVAIKPESPADEAAIHAAHSASFCGDGEAWLVDALRAAGRLVVSLVAVSHDTQLLV